MNWNWCRVSRWDREIFQILSRLAPMCCLYSRACWQFPYWLHVPPHMYFYVEFNFKANMFFILTIIQFGKLIFPILMGKLLKISPKWEEILKSAYFSPKSGKKMEQLGIIVMLILRKYKLIDHKFLSSSQFFVDNVKSKLV